MLEHHVDIETPESSTQIWRYMGLEKFLGMLTSSSLWLSSCLFFEDKWEGYYSQATVDLFLKSFKGEKRLIRRAWKSHEKVNAMVRNSMFMNCWHVSEDESPALWQIYAPFGKSIAVKSTIHRLRDSLANSEEQLFGGTVKYIDYAKDPIEWGNVLTPFFRKRRAFSFEREFRLAYWHTADFDKPKQLNATGFAIKVDLERLIQSVYVSPKSEPFIRESITALLAKFNLEKADVIQSDFFSKTP